MLNTLFLDQSFQSLNYVLFALVVLAAALCEGARGLLGLHPRRDGPVRAGVQLVFHHALELEVGVQFLCC